MQCLGLAWRHAGPAYPCRYLLNQFWKCALCFCNEHKTITRAGQMRQLPYWWLGGSLDCILPWQTWLALVQVLGLEESAGETAIRRQFRRLAQQVHPDKTRCFGAESAFKLISKAASVVTSHASASAAGANERDNICANFGKLSSLLGILSCLQSLMRRAQTLKHLLLITSPNEVLNISAHSHGGCSLMLRCIVRCARL